MIKNLRADLQRWKLLLSSVSSKLKNPKERINDLRLRFDDWSERLSSAAKNVVDRKKQRLDRVEASLMALSPLKVLERGYSIAFVDGQAVKSSDQLPPGEKFKLRLHDGSVDAQSI